MIGQGNSAEASLRRPRRNIFPTSERGSVASMEETLVEGALVGSLRVPLPMISVP